MLANELISHYAIIHTLNELAVDVDHLAIYGIKIPEIVIDYASAWIAVEEPVRLSVSCPNESTVNIYLRRISNGKLIRRAKIVREVK